MGPLEFKEIGKRVSELMNFKQPGFDSTLQEFRENVLARQASDLFPPSFFISSLLECYTQTHATTFARSSSFKMWVSVSNFDVFSSPRCACVCDCVYSFVYFPFLLLFFFLLFGVLRLRLVEFVSDGPVCAARTHTQPANRTGMESVKMARKV